MTLFRSSTKMFQARKDPKSILDGTSKTTVVSEGREKRSLIEIRDVAGCHASGGRGGRPIHARSEGEMAKASYANKSVASLAERITRNHSFWATTELTSNAGNVGCLK